VPATIIAAAALEVRLLLSPHKTESIGRRSGALRYSQAPTVKSGGVSYSLSKLPSPGASLSPASPIRGVFDFNNVDPFGYELNLSETSSYVSHHSRTLGLLNLPRVPFGFPFGYFSCCNFPLCTRFR
jgi:hypothetical protein